MRVFFISFLVLNLLLECVAAIFLIGGPAGAFLDVHPENGNWVMNYGFAAIAIASAIFWVWPGRDNILAVGSVLGILFTFHTLLFVSFAIQGNQMAYMIVHGAMAALAAFLYSQRSRWCTN